MSLSGWDSYKKIQLTLDSSLIDADLTDFVLDVQLGAAVGKTGFDATVIFTELGTNSKKIAFEVGDTGVQCYGEIVSWDNINEVAHLCIKVPTAASATDTIINFYYDSAHADNTTYIGDTGSTPAQTVHSGRVFASHQAQDPSGTAPQILDSSPNAKHGTSYGSMTSGDLIDGLTGKAIEYDGVDDYTNHGYDPAHDITDVLTIRAVIKPSVTLDSSLTSNRSILSRQNDSTTGEDSYTFIINTIGRLHLGTYGGNIQSAKDVWTAGTTYVVHATYNATGLVGELFVDGVKEVLGYDALDTMSGSTNNLVIGKDLAAGTFFPGMIDEVIIVNAVMSDAWVKADNAALLDNLITLEVTQIGGYGDLIIPVPSIFGDDGTIYGDCELLIPLTEITATGDVTSAGVGNLNVPSIVISSYGDVYNYAALGSLESAIPVISSLGWNSIICTGNISPQRPIYSGSVLVTLIGDGNFKPKKIKVYGNYGSLGLINIKKPSINANCINTIILNGDINIKKPSISAYGIKTLIASADIIVKVPKIIAYSSILPFGIGNLNTQDINISSYGYIQTSGNVSLNIKPPTIFGKSNIATDYTVIKYYDERICH